MSSILFDLRYALRRLLRSPVFSAIIILTLALGIGANTAIFSVVDTVLLRPAAYREPAQLVEVFHWYEGLKLHANVSAPGFKAYRDETHDFDAVAVTTGWGVNLTGAGDPQRLNGIAASGDFWKVLGVPPEAGRTFGRDEDAIGKERVAVITDGLWKRIFGGRADILGKDVSLNGEPYTIIGIMPPSFVDPWNPNTEIWRPLALTPDNFDTNNFTNEFMRLIARLKPGVTVKQAGRDMGAFALDLIKRYPNQLGTYWTLRVTSYAESTTGNVRTPLLWLLAAVGVVLLIACANVANMLLARAAARQREVAVRTALGAERWALVRQFLVESVLLSVVGGALGLLVADSSLRALVAINPASIPGAAMLEMNGAVVAFTFAIAVITGVLFGLAPALHTSSGDLHAALKEGGRGGTTDRKGQFVRWSLVVSEMALAVVLSFGGGLLLKSFARLANVDPGFDPHNVLTFNVSLPKSQYPTDTAMRAFYARLVPSIAQVPGVLAAGATSVLPFGGSWSTGSFNVEGYTPPAKGNSPWGDIRIVSPEFLATLKVPRFAGRMFDARDAQAAPAVCIVDDEFLHKYYGKDKSPEFALGKRIFFSNLPITDSTKFITIVGVVGHTKHEGLDADPRVQVYFPVDQINFPLNFINVAVRTAGDPMASVSAVRTAVLQVDRNMAISQINPLEKLVDNSLGRRRLAAILLGVFSSLALFLAALGIYGVMSYAVAQRTREIGVRVALGASRSSVLQLIVGQGAVIAVIGGAIGIAGALVGAWVLRSQLFAVQWWDPGTLLAIVALLGVAVVVASAIPALRAASIHPTEALREE
jgi:putative ABC transport system permease protein